ncbi:MAG TPA: TolC family protein, partial [Longimicrobiales bacterium]|nr:TolC family protein [Longimicrobiales bacterium]
MLKSLLLVSAFCAFAASLSAQTPSAQRSVQGDTLTLNEVVERALRASPDMVIAESSVSNAQSAERLALGNYLPSLSLTTNYGLASSDRLNPETNTIVSGSSDSYRAGLNAGLDIFTGGRRGAET